MRWESSSQRSQVWWGLSMGCRSNFELIIIEYCLIIVIIKLQTISVLDKKRAPEFSGSL